MCRSKTGSTSIIKLLQERYDAEIYKKWPKSVLRSHKSDRDTRHVCLMPMELMNQGYYVFALVRNPYAIEVSRFNYWPSSSDWRLMEERFRWPVEYSFSDYLWGHLKKFDISLSDAYLSHEHTTHKECSPYVVDQFLHLEKLQEEFMTLPFVEECVQMPRENVEKHQALSLYNSVKDVDRVHDLRRDDFENFGYSKKLPWKLWTAKTL